MPIIKSDYIKDKLSYIQSKINNDTKLQLYDINKTAEDIFMHLLNLTYGWNLQNANDEIINFPAIDLMDTTNEIVIQVTSDTRKKKVKEDTIEAFNKLVKEDKYKIYAHYEIKMFYIKDKPSKSTLKNWEDEGLISQSNILGIEDINKEISADTTHTLATKVFRYLCNLFHDKICESDTSPQLTTKLGKSTLIGREKELQEIDEQLKASKTLLVKGIGGVGKSTIASNYLHRHKDEYDYYGFFEGLESFETELEGAFNLKIEHGQDRLNRVLRELIKLEPDGKKLLVIDDVKEIKKNQDKLEKILGLEHNGYRVILTSRFRVKNVEIYPLATLNPLDAQKLFLDNYKTEELEKVNQITEYLDYHPLFIELVAKTIKNEDSSFDEIIEKFELGELAKIEFIDEEEGDEVSFNQNLQKLFEMQKKSLKDEYLLLLKQLAVLPSIDIELSFLEEIFNKKLKSRLNFLIDQGWLIESVDGYKLHQLIKVFLLSNYPPNFEDIELIIDFFEKNTKESGDPSSAIKNRKYMIYFDSIIFVINQINIKNIKIVNLFTGLGNIYNHLGYFEQAQSLYKKVMIINENIFGKEHLYTAKSYSNLAENYKLVKEYNNSEFYHQESLKINEKMLGENHLNTAINYHNLGGLYLLTKNYNKSEELYLKALYIRESLSEKPLIMASSYNGLGELYRHTTEYEKALVYYHKALKIREEVLGEYHPSTVLSYHNLALLLGLIGKVEESKYLFKKGLSINMEIQDENYFGTKIIESNLASLLQTSVNNKSFIIDEPETCLYSTISKHKINNTKLNKNFK